jgi:hypothetical protein
MFDQVGGGELSFDLPPATFGISTTDSRWWPYPPTGVPEVVCRGPAALVTDCCQPPAPMAAVDCQEYPLSCDDHDDMCALAFDYDDAKEIDLRNVPALQDQRRWVLAQATVDHLNIAASQTDAGVAPLPLRAVNLYVAPQGVVSAHAASATFLTGIPWTSKNSQVALAVEAQVALSAFLTDFNTPFVLILSSHVVEESGPAPSGAMSVVVSFGRVKASY